MMEDPPAPLTDLLTRAANGDQRAWGTLVDRYAPLIWSICRKHNLSDDDARNTGQAVWLQLAAQLGHLREPAALAAWLATTTRRECRKAQRVARELQAGGHALDVQSSPDKQTEIAGQEQRAAERDAMLREAFTRLPPCCQRLLAMLIEDPPMPYAQISTTLGIPAARIEPSRGRCLDKLRRDPALAALINPGAVPAGGDMSRQIPAQ